MGMFDKPLKDLKEEYTNQVGEGATTVIKEESPADEQDPLIRAAVESKEARQALETEINKNLN